MKKTIKTNIGGSVFHLDDDAYSYLKEYLDRLNQKFGSSASAKEVMEDIELRIAELLEKELKGRECAGLDEVKKVTEILGSPEDFEEDGTAESWTGPEAANREKSIRRLYRDSDNAILGGVCTGLGAYFNVDPLLFRIVFIAFLIAFGSTAIIYIILWIVVPPARTMAQKLEMAGKPVTIENMERALQEELHDIQSNVRNIQVASWGRKIFLFLQELLRVVIGFLGKVFQFAGVLLGGIFVLIGLFLLLITLWMFFVQKPIYTGMFDDANFRLNELAAIFFPETDPVILAIGVALFTGIPIVFMLYWGLKLAFRIRTGNRAVGIAGAIAWVFSFFLLLMIGLTEAQEYQRTGSQEERFSLDTLKKHAYVLEVDTTGWAAIKKDAIFAEKDQFGLYYSRNSNKVTGKPFLDVIKSEEGNAYIVVTKESQGKNEKEAVENARKIQYTWSVKDHKIVLGSFFFLPSGFRWKGARVSVRLYLPEGSKIYIPETATNILDYFESCEAVNRRYLAGKTWEVDDSGLCNPE